MKLADFIREHAEELDQAINRTLNHVPRTASCSCPKSGTEHEHPATRLTNAERRQWILNDEGLYLWARMEGCRI